MHEELNNIVINGARKTEALSVTYLFQSLACKNYLYELCYTKIEIILRLMKIATKYLPTLKYCKNKKNESYHARL